MSRHKVGLIAVLFLTQYLWSMPFAGAAVYTYTGNNFSAVDPPYTTSDSISGSITLSSALGSNFNGFVTPQSFSFTDGVQTLTTEGDEFLFITGPTGAITQWEVVIGFGSYLWTINCPTLCTAHPPTVQDFATHFLYTDANGFNHYASAANDDSHGQWSFTPLSAAPLPHALPLFATGLGVLGLLGWRKKRKTQAFV